jgi:hypothetical protein
VNPLAEVEALLRRCRFTLRSENRHYKFGDPHGRVYVMPKTPSDRRAWANALSVLKRVVASPPPSSAILEEERQRKALEEFIRLNPAKKAAQGISGAGKGKKSRGTGFVYDDVIVPFVPEEAKEQARQNAEWDKAIRHFRKQRRKAEEELGGLFREARIVLAIDDARAEVAKLLRGVRASAEWATAWKEKTRTREQRDELVKWLVARALSSDCEKPGDSMLEALIADGDVTLRTAVPEDAGEAEQAQSHELLGNAASLAVLMWAHSDTRKPGWLAWSAEYVSTVPVGRHMQLMFGRLERCSRGVQGLSPRAEEVLGLLRRIPWTLRKKPETRTDAIRSECGPRRTTDRIVVRRERERTIRARYARRKA